MVNQSEIYKKNQSYLKWLIRRQKEGYLVSEEITLIRQNNINEQDVPHKFVPSNKFQGLI